MRAHPDTTTRQVANLRYGRVPLCVTAATHQNDKVGETSGRRSVYQQGFVLAGILVLILLGSMLAVSVLYRLQAEETATASGAGGEQAWAAAMSGVAKALGVLQRAGPDAADWQDNPSLFTLEPRIVPGN